MKDEWFFEIGDGQVYGPFPLVKLKGWATSGDLMPTHRVRHADSHDWIIAAYVPGLEDTTKIVEPNQASTVAEVPKSFRESLGAFVGLGRSKGNRELITDDGGVAGPPGKKSAGQKNPLKVIEYCNEILTTAIRRNASDIHVDPMENVTLIQLRIDGRLETFKKLSSANHPALIGRLKIIANMDIAEHRIPQDGRFRFESPENRRIDIRVACLPTIHGERLTLRLLAVETEQLTINKIGLAPPALEAFTKVMSNRQGLILVTGPTGSGKSTTLYAAIRHYLAHHPGKIITIEDPVEFDIVGVSQVEISANDTVRFGAALRNILRSDPDAIMIGEIRDFESADIAIKAALTGHLVFTSLHANSAASAVTRLVDIGIPSYLVAATLRLSIAQRLVRKLCPHCRRPRALTAKEAQDAGQPQSIGVTVYEPGDCEQCHGRGYRGRVGVFELLPITQQVSALISGGKNEEAILGAQRAMGMLQLKEDGFAKVLAGQCSFSEWLAEGWGQQ